MNITLLDALQGHGRSEATEAPQRSEDSESVTAASRNNPPFLLGRVLTSTGRSGRRKTDGVQGMQKLTVEDAGTYSEHIVTTSIIKSGTVPGLRPGAAALFSGGSELDAAFVIRLRGPPLCGGRYLRCFRTGADGVRCKGGHSSDCPQDS